MTARLFKQVDVFTERPFLGNPVAVILDAAGLSDEEMQRIARWTNLSETTFVLPSERADYRLRIFTPGRELPFAGHPTVGSAHAVLEAGIASARDGRLAQECLAGVIPLSVAPDGAIAARVPPPSVVRDAHVEGDAVAGALGAPLVGPRPLPIDVGPIWLIAQVAPEALRALQPDLAAVLALSKHLGLTGVTAFSLGDDGAVRVRSFAPAEGITEDPVCGSGNAAVGAYLGATGLLSRTGRRYVASQGVEIGRDGRVAVAVTAPDHVEIGGHAVTVIDGTLRSD